MSDLVPNQNNFILYTTPDGAVELNVLLENETIWLTQEQMSQLFDRERSVITKHIANVFREGELEEKSNVQILHISDSDKRIRKENAKDSKKWNQNRWEFKNWIFKTERRWKMIRAIHDNWSGTTVGSFVNIIAFIVTFMVTSDVIWTKLILFCYANLILWYVGFYLGWNKENGDDL